MTTGGSEDIADDIELSGDLRERHGPTEASRSNSPHPLIPGSQQSHEPSNRVRGLLAPWIWTLIFAIALVIVIRVYGAKSILQPSQKNEFQFITTGLLLFLGLSLNESFKGLAKVLRHHLERFSFPSTARHLVDSFNALLNVVELLWSKIDWGFRSFCIIWIAQLASASISLTYGVDDGHNYTSIYTRNGPVNVSNLACYKHPHTPGCPSAVTTDALAHAYGESPSAADSTQPSDCGYFTDAASIINSKQKFRYYCRRDTTIQEFAYQFKEYNPDDAQKAYPHSTNRTIMSSSGRCNEYTQGAVNDIMLGDLSAKNFTYSNDANVEGSIVIPTLALGNEGTTYIYRGVNRPEHATTYGNGDRGLMMWAYRNPGAKQGTLFYECPINIGVVGNVKDPKHNLTDGVARQAAASIALQGQWRGTRGHMNWVQWQWYASGQPWEIHGKSNSQVGANIAEHAMVSLTEMATRNPTIVTNGTVPYLGSHLNVQWQSFVPLLACIVAADTMVVALSFIAIRYDPKITVNYRIIPDRTAYSADESKSSIKNLSITLTATRDSSDGSSVSEKPFPPSTILSRDDHISFTQDDSSNPLSNSASALPSNPPPPFSALYFPPLHPATYAGPSTVESDSCPPPPFAPSISGASPSQAPSAFERETKAAFACETKGESPTKSSEEKEPPPPYTEGSSPLGSFTYVMAAAGGPASIITQVPQGGPPLPPGGHSFADVGAEENINLDLRGTRFTLSREELLTLPEFVLLSLFPNGLLPDGHMNSFHEGDTYPVDYDPTSLQYMLDFFRTVAQTIPSSSPSPVADAPSTEANIPGSARDMLQDRAGIIVLREDLDFYAIPPKAEIDQSEMIEVKRAAGRALLKQDGIFSGLRKSEEQGTTEQHLIEMLTAGGFSNDDRWGHRASEPNKAVICSLALARLRTDIKGNDLANSNAVGMAQKLLLFWRKPARRCWWEGVELYDVDGVEGKLKTATLVRLVLPTESANLFRKHLGKTFRSGAKARNHEVIRTALSAGYGVLDDLACRKRNVLRQLSELARLQNLPSELRSKDKTPLRPQRAKTSQSSTLRPDDGRRWPHPDAERVLDGLPLPPLEHHYHVPTLINANHIPFLRYKKPQSPFLSHMIREKTRERIKRVDKIQALEKAGSFAEDEDQWDRILWEVNRVSPGDGGVQWASVVREALSNVKNLHSRIARSRVQAAQRMFDIVQEQRKLSDKAKVERRNWRHQEYKARKRQRAAQMTGEHASLKADDDCQPAISAAAV
ncbi:MAG: hypothetical protein Q9202_001373 [Teloschistes flavicans]